MPDIDRVQRVSCWADNEGVVTPKSTLDNNIQQHLYPLISLVVVF